MTLSCSRPGQSIEAHFQDCLSLGLGQQIAAWDDAEPEVSFRAEC